MFLPSFVSLSTLKALTLELPTNEVQSTAQLLYSLAGIKMTELRSFSFKDEQANAQVQGALAAFLGS